jgi:type IX secretion system PorP/SprF family membrane protein
MLKKLTLLTIYLYLFVLTASGQQLTAYLQKSEFFGIINPATVNPDFMTDKYHNSVGLSTQHQWIRLGNISPTTQILRGEMMGALADNLILGAYIVNDRIGITNETGGYLRGAYIIDLFGDISEGGLSLGGNIGAVNWSIHPSRLDPSSVNDPYLPNIRSSGYLDLGLGAFFYKQLGRYSDDKSQYFYAGLSMPRTFDMRQNTHGAERFSHLYGLVGYYAPTGNGFLEASAWVRKVKNVPLQTSFNLRWRIQEYITLGGSVLTDFNPNNQVLFCPEFAINLPKEGNRHSHNFRIGYGYMVGTFTSYFGGTHELNLTWSFD